MSLRGDTEERMVRSHRLSWHTYSSSHRWNLSFNYSAGRSTTQDLKFISVKKFKNYMQEEGQGELDWDVAAVVYTSPKRSASWATARALNEERRFIRSSLGNRRKRTRRSQ